jgi:hypothetical protein
VNVRAALVPALVAVLLTGCAAGQETSAGQEITAPASTAPSGSASPVPSAPATPSAAATPSAPAVRTVEVSYAGGQVTGTSGREEVPVGEDVVLRVSSDVAEEVHVHGYDLEGAIPAGGSVDIPLTASIPGVFEVELHDSGKVLFQLRVA